MNEPVKVGTYLGYDLVLRTISYDCDRLALRGYRDELALARAVYRELKKRGSLPPNAEKPTAWFDRQTKSGGSTTP